MKNKGFTLIELLLVIAIIGILGTVITINLSSVLNDNETSTCNNYLSEIEDAAKVYYTLNREDNALCISSGCQISLKELIEEGLVDENNGRCNGNSGTTNITSEANTKVTIKNVDGERIVTIDAK